MSEENKVELAHIKFSTQIIKRLGEELNPSFDQSILELVKNSYDADARECEVVLTNITQVGGSIEISDDGDGMDSEDIKNGWLVLGQSSKSQGKLSRTLKRITAGSKGLGRLAALRMGKLCELESISHTDVKSKFSLSIDWDRFDKGGIVEDVALPISKEAMKTEGKTGSKISINNLKHIINERDVKKIARGLILLSDPFDEDPSSFKPKLKSSEFKAMEDLVSKRYFNDADYHLVANIDENGIGSATVRDYRGEILYSGTHSEIRGSKLRDRIYVCPAFSFDLWAFLLNNTNFSTRNNTISEVREWLTEFGGVHLYENRLRVNPYGNQGNDWLDMNLSRAKSPEERPSTNTSIGVVRIKDSKGTLSQKTDRSGFIENDVFHEIKKFCQEALDWMAKKRLEQAEKRRQREKTTSTANSNVSKTALKEKIEHLPEEKKVEFKKAFEEYDKAMERQLKVLRADVQLYRTLSTAGITAATFSHESNGNPIKVINITIQSLESRIQKRVDPDVFNSYFAKQIASIKNALKSLAVLGSATLKLLAHEKRRPVKLNIHGVINEVVNTFKPFLDGRNISTVISFAAGNPFLRGTEAAVESIVTNLLNNSIVAFENQAAGNREIRISTVVSENLLSISVEDNGPGIKGIEIKDIWLPGHTTNPNGTGLGLTIVKDAVNDLGGNVEAFAKSDLGGAKIVVELPIIGLEK